MNTNPANSMRPNIPQQVHKHRNDNFELFEGRLQTVKYGRPESITRFPRRSTGMAKKQKKQHRVRFSKRIARAKVDDGKPLKDLRQIEGGLVEEYRGKVRRGQVPVTDARKWRRLLALEAQELEREARENSARDHSMDEYRKAVQSDDREGKQLLALQRMHEDHMIRILHLKREERVQYQKMADSDVQALKKIRSAVLRENERLKKEALIQSRANEQKAFLELIEQEQIRKKALLKEIEERALRRKMRNREEKEERDRVARSDASNEEKKQRALAIERAERELRTAECVKQNLELVTDSRKIDENIKYNAIHMLEKQQRKRIESALAHSVEELKKVKDVREGIRLRAVRSETEESFEIRKCLEKRKRDRIEDPSKYHESQEKRMRALKLQELDRVQRQSSADLHKRVEYEKQTRAARLEQERKVEAVRLEREEKLHALQHAEKRQREAFEKGEITDFGVKRNRAMALEEDERRRRIESASQHSFIEWEKVVKADARETKRQRAILKEIEDDRQRLEAVEKRRLEALAQDYVLGKRLRLLALKSESEELIRRMKSAEAHQKEVYEKCIMYRTDREKRLRAIQLEEAEQKFRERSLLQQYRDECAKTEDDRAIRRLRALKAEEEERLARELSVKKHKEEENLKAMVYDECKTYLLL